MKIGIVAPAPVPAVTGGAERLWESLQRGLDGLGHDCEIINIPFPETTLREVLEGYRAFSDLDVSHFDLVVTGKYPAWMVHHERHHVYMLHPLRGLYDTYPTHLPRLEDTSKGLEIIASLSSIDDPLALIDAGLSLVDSTPRHAELDAFPGPLARWLVQRLDRMALDPARITTHAAISEEVARRQGYFPPLAEVLVSHPPTSLSLSPAPPSGRTTFFTASRLDRPKRIDLLIEGFAALSDPSAVLHIAGEGPDEDRLRQRAADDDRVRFLGRLSDATLADAYAHATAVVFCPWAEDFGYITLEAMQAGTPVVTTYDSGGPAELVDHTVNGLIVGPEPELLAWAMSHLAGSDFARWHMGLNAQRTAAGVTWDRLFDQILASPKTRPRALVLSTYGVDPMVGGGQRRIRHLDRALARHADVTVLALSGKTKRHRRRRLEAGLSQVEIARSSFQRQAEGDIFDLLDVPVDDLTIGRLAEATPDFGRELEYQLARSDVVVLSQPFLSPLLPPNLDLPIVHDSQNVEVELKSQLLDDDDIGHWLLDQTIEAETRATVASDLIVACTEADLKALQSVDPEGGQRGLVVPNGVDTRAMPFRTAEQHRRARGEILAFAGFEPSDDRPLGLFIGSWHPPNVEAGRLVIELARVRSDWIFVLAGSHVSSYADIELPPNLHLVPGFPESLLWPLLAAADLALNPMVSGGGSNLKVFDYLSVGVPVLTTPVGARGLPDPDRYAEVVSPAVAALSDGLSRLVDSAHQEAVRQRLARGRALVEEKFDWEHLGKDWATAVLETAGLTPSDESKGTPDQSVRSLRPILATSDPPTLDPVLAAMDAVGRQALEGDPQPQDSIMDPVVRELLGKASDNRNVGRELPDDARLKAPKKALIRAGHALSNEQVVFNEAMLEILEHLSVQVGALQAENASLLTRLRELEKGTNDQ